MRFHVVVIGRQAAQQMAPFEVGRLPSLRTSLIHARRAVSTVLKRTGATRETTTVGNATRTLWSKSAPDLQGEWDYYGMAGGYFPIDPERRKEYSSGAPHDVEFGLHTGANPELDALAGEHPKVDVVRVGDIDHERAHQEERLALSAEFEEWISVVNRLGRPTPAKEMVPPGAHINAEPWLRYRRQPAIDAASDVLPYREDADCLVDFYGYELESFLKRQARQYPLVPWAIVHKGRWLANTADDGPLVPGDQWDSFVDDVWRSLPPDTLLTAFECHA